MSMGSPAIHAGTSYILAKGEGKSRAESLSGGAYPEKPDGKPGGSGAAVPAFGSAEMP